MSAGRNQGDAPAGASVVLRTLQKNGGLRAHLASPLTINRQYRVPYLAGSSIGLLL